MIDEEKSSPDDAPAAGEGAVGQSATSPPENPLTDPKPPGNPEVDEEKLKKAEETLGGTGAN